MAPHRIEMGGRAMFLTRMVDDMEITLAEYEPAVMPDMPPIIVYRTAAPLWLGEEAITPSACRSLLEVTI